MLAEDQDDFRVGGREVSRFGQSGGPTYEAETNYLDILPERRIIMAGMMTHRERRISASLGTVELRPAGSGTRLVYTEQSAFLDGLDTVESHEQGWGEILDKLDSYLAERGVDPRPIDEGTGPARFATVRDLEANAITFVEDRNAGT